MRSLQYSAGKKRFFDNLSIFYWTKSLVTKNFQHDPCKFCPRRSIIIPWKAGDMMKKSTIITAMGIGFMAGTAAGAMVCGGLGQKKSKANRLMKSISEIVGSAADMFGM